ncbi:MAG: LysR family transcriptional regulator [Bdellovibrionaceae bacterium]|nr:LysR family transcriptional regulator [Pseudobdellovibrionaceae bacterium]
MELDLTRIFVKVVQFNSFSKAAVMLKMPKSTVSKSISRLEKETGTKLLVRSTRSLTVTEAGRTFYEACLGPIHLIEDAQKALSGQDNLLTGLVRITAPEDLGTFIIAPAIAKLSAQHPMLRFELLYTDNLVDLVKDGFDLAVRIGRMRDSGLKLKRAGEVILVPVASPAYLKQKEKLKSPRDLAQHQCLTLNLRQTVDRWTLRSGDKAVHVGIQSKILSNQMSSLLRMALADAGIALVPTYICQSYLDNGKLVRVLPEWSSPGWPVSMISPLSPSSSARLKTTVDHIANELKRAGIV